MTTEVGKLLEKVTKLYESAIRDWLKERTESNIKAEVRRKLDNDVDTIIAKLLGFNNRWDKWELDHCNGRSGESAAGDWLRARVGEEVSNWLSDQAGNLPKLPKTAVASLKKNYLDEFEREAGRLLREQAVKDAREFVTNRVGDFKLEEGD